MVVRLNTKHVDLLIIGAGPFGLSMASYGEHHGIDYLVVGKPMSFWKENMPEGMYLRSGCEWHLDPQGVHTIDKYLEARNLERKDVEPLSLDFYLGYAEWFQERINADILNTMVKRLDSLDDEKQRFSATLDNGNTLTAKNVLLAVGFKNFRNLPPELTEIIPDDRYTHTCDLVEFDYLRGKRCLVIGGRQSAYEWAALVNENGASEVHVSHRHETPDFTRSEWNWVYTHLDAMTADPEGHINMPAHKRQALDKRFWTEGRLKLEPWLKKRVDVESVKIWPESEIKACEKLPDGELEVEFDSGDRIAVDHVILATGYKVNIENVPFLKAGNVLERLRIQEGYPVLDAHLQTSVPGLFATSMMATRDFGLFFAFTVSVHASAEIIGSFIKNS
ncbi:MAG: NAD(P)-binding domain-containing protein [Deltaproteobacteria bacterium]